MFPVDSITESRVTRISKFDERTSLGDIFQNGLSSSILQMFDWSSTINHNESYRCTAVTGHSIRALSSLPSSCVPTWKLFQPKSFLLWSDLEWLHHVLTVGDRLFAWSDTINCEVYTNISIIMEIVEPHPCMNNWSLLVSAVWNHTSPSVPVDKNICFLLPLSQPRENFSDENF